MMPQEQIFFADNFVYITNMRLVLRKGRTYSIANLAQVTFGRLVSSRSWIGPFTFGLILLALAVLLSQVSVPAEYSVLLNGKPYLIIGGSSLLLIGGISVLLQVVYPLYVVVIKGNFGTARLLTSRDRHYVLKVVEALNEAIRQRDILTPPNVINLDQSIHDYSYHSSDINIGQGAQANISTSGSASNVKQVPDTSLNTLSNRAQAVDNSGVLGKADQPRAQSVQPMDQPVPASTRTQKIIISYSHEDHQWLGLLRTHLAPLERQHMIVIWDDTQITAGTHTQQAMTNALKAADFALLLVSANFLASDIIMHYELPQILQRHSQGQFTILPLIISPCLYNESSLGRYRPFNPDNPLSMLSFPERDDILVHVAREIQKTVL